MFLDSRRKTAQVHLGGKGGQEDYIFIPDARLLAEAQ